MPTEDQANLAQEPEPTEDQAILTQRPDPRPEGQLISRAMELRNISAPAAATELGLSPGRVRQIINGSQPLGGGQYRVVVGKSIRIAQLAQLTGVTPQQLADANRHDAAQDLKELLADQASHPRQPAQPVNADELRLIRDNDQLPLHLRQWADTLLQQLHAIRQAAEDLGRAG